MANTSGRYGTGQGSNLSEYFYGYLNFSERYGTGHGSNGEYFYGYLNYDLSTCGTIKKIAVYSGSVTPTPRSKSLVLIRGISLSYTGGQIVNYGTLTGSLQELSLSDGEFVTKVEGRSGWEVDQLTFVTNKGNKLGPCGGNGGQEFTADFDGKALIALFGQAGQQIDSIGFAIIEPDKLTEEEDQFGRQQPSNISVQSTLLESYTAYKPSDDSTLYIKKFEPHHGEHLVIGVRVVLSPSHPNGLWKKFHIDRTSNKLDPKNPQVVTRALTICCDTLEVHGEFCLPEANVTIYARNLVWKTHDAAINTTPLDWATKAKDAANDQPGQDGVPGRKAGNLNIFIKQTEELYFSGSKPHLVANGGRGQDPGEGLNGSPGSDCEFKTEYEDRWQNYPGGDSPNILRVKFDTDKRPPAVHITVRWKSGAYQATRKWGAENPYNEPGNGGNALAPGKPGNGGSGGQLTTNFPKITKILLNDGGQPGIKRGTYSGGRAGEPNHCAAYRLIPHYRTRDWSKTVHLDPDTEVDFEKRADYRSKPGQNKSGSPGSPGSKPEPRIIPSDSTAPWLHPLSIQKVLEYAHDLFLAEDRQGVQNFIAPYAEALALEMPDDDGWNNEVARGQWNNARHEVELISHNLRSRLDYYGNPGGYAPLFALPAAYEQYREGIKQALQMLLLVQWIEKQQEQATKAEQAFEETIKSANEENQKASKEISEAEIRIRRLRERSSQLKKDLDLLQSKLNNLREALHRKAEANVHKKHQIDFAISMATALCQVIPYGQPALGGATSSLSNVAKSLAENGGSVSINTVSQIGGLLETIDGLATSVEENPSEEGKSDPGRLAHVGASIGPSLSSVSESLQALQVPQSEIDAELQRLIAQSDEWNDLVQEIRKINEQKVALANDLVAVCRSLNENYARISANASAVVSLQKQRSTTLDKVDPMALGLVKQLGQKSRMALNRYRYVMVKAYETTTLEPIDIDWRLTNLTERVSDLLQGNSDLDVSTLNEHVEALQPIFQQNLDRVRDALSEKLDGLISMTHKKPVGLTPDLIASLNTSRRAIFNPVTSGLLSSLEDYHLIRLKKVTIKAIEFDPDGPQLTEDKDLELKLTPSQRSIIRKGEKLYSIYSQQPLTWTWDLTGSSTSPSQIRIYPARISEANKDVQDLVVGENAERIRQKLTLPSVWSDMSLEIDTSLMRQETPRLTKLIFDFDYDAVSAPNDQCVVNIQSLGLDPGLPITCSPDLEDRRAGFAPITRIYPKNFNVELSLSDSEESGGIMFDKWEVTTALGDTSAFTEKVIKIVTEDHLNIKCHWKDNQSQ